MIVLFGSYCVTRDEIMREQHTPHTNLKLSRSQIESGSRESLLMNSMSECSPLSLAMDSGSSTSSLSDRSRYVRNGSSRIGVGNLAIWLLDMCRLVIFVRPENASGRAVRLLLLRDSFSRPVNRQISGGTYKKGLSKCFTI